jgi:hypothetical protein
MPTLSFKIAVYPPPGSDLPYLVACIDANSGTVEALMAESEERAESVAHEWATKLYAAAADPQEDDDA